MTPTRLAPQYSTDRRRAHVFRALGFIACSYLPETYARMCRNRYPIVRRRPSYLKPRVDIIRDPDSGLINCQVELPGLKFEEIRLTVHGGRLVIDGTRHLPIKNAGKSKSTFLVHEVEYGRIHRKIALPPDIQAHEISAILADGMLEMTWPCVSAHTKPPRRIQITDAEQ